MPSSTPRNGTPLWLAGLALAAVPFLVSSPSHGAELSGWTSGSGTVEAECLGGSCTQGEKTPTQARDDGHYRFRDIRPGRYAVRFAGRVWVVQVRPGRNRIDLR